MCGFLGFARGDAIEYSTDDLLKILNKLSHRGPDGEGYYDDSNVFLGHKRLSIIDLSAGASQPLKSKSRNAFIVFNGEIYNYKSLATSLRLETSSDTEVLLEGFLTRGISFLSEVRGIYSFVIYTIDDQRIYLYRDLAGVKPLYYSLDINHKKFICSSEIKAILPLLTKVSINEKVVKQYIHLGYCLEPNTIYNEICALDPGHLLEYDIKQGSCKKSTVNQYDWKHKVKGNEFVKETDHLLKEACRRNLVSDVDVSLALSGGIDSSLLLGCLSESNSIKSLSVKFSEHSYDETPISEIYSQRFNSLHKTVSVENTGDIDLLDKLLLHFDQPYADSSLIPFYLLNREASTFTKVLLGGDGGDEIQNGYSGYRFLPMLLALSGRKITLILPRFFDLFKFVLRPNKQRELMKLIAATQFQSKLDAILNWNSWFPTLVSSYPINPFKFASESVFDDLKPNYDQENSKDLIQEVLFKTQLQSDFLRKADMMSMISGVEYRVPMLDEDLTSYSLSIPYRHKSTFFNQKKIFKKLHRMMYPKHLSSSKKKGFSIPLDVWLGDKGIARIEEYVNFGEGIVNQYINKEYLDVLFMTIRGEDPKLARYCSRSSAYQRMLILYSLQLWYFEIFKKHSTHL
jgi:asparagine synthase (glutamine-hydrolysing)